ncbi:MAG: hypothetical protein DMG28_05870 [Acidobacteria bacterium]|nr:MAG: hypothetical protein DMG28_05870 [Acidobacteriota bacterium]
MRADGTILEANSSLFVSAAFMFKIVILTLVETNPVSLQKTVGTIFSAYSGQAEQAQVSQIRPWVRYWARFIDMWIGALLFTALMIITVFLGLVDRSFVNAKGSTLLFAIGFSFAWSFLEADLLCTWGTTPGKWLLKTTVRDSSGQKLKFVNALDRSFSVWIRGLGIGITFVAIFTLIIAYRKLTRDGKTSWDEYGRYVVSHERIGPLRVVLAVLLILCFCSLFAFGVAGEYSR